MNKERVKAKEVKPFVEECIRNGMDYSKTRKELKKQGMHYPNLAKTFYTWQQNLHPENARTEALTAVGERKREKQKKGSILTGKAWSKQKQKEADESVFADVLNEAVFYFVPCPQKGLTKEDVKEINLGGGVVGLVTYYTDINLNHPIIVFVVRTIMLVLKVRAMCFEVQKKVEDVKAKLKAEGLFSPVLRGQEKGHSD